LLAACEKLVERPQKIVLVSSSYVYGDTGSAPAREDAALEPRDAYAKSKREMEIVATRWFDRLPLIIARPFNYTGVGHGERFLVPKLVRAFCERDPDVSFVDPSVVRDYSDVRWVAEVYVSLLQCPVAGQVVNVCSGTGTPLTALVDALQELTGRRPASYPKPPAGARTVALVGDPSRLKGLIGRSSPFSLRDTLTWMLETAAAQGRLARAEA
jgi:nucleoside-diphosphate-sugar epimerase